MQRWSFQFIFSQLIMQRLNRVNGGDSCDIALVSHQFWGSFVHAQHGEDFATFTIQFTSVTSPLLEDFLLWSWEDIFEIFFTLSWFSVQPLGTLELPYIVYIEKRLSLFLNSCFLPLHSAKRISCNSTFIWLIYNSTLFSVYCSSCFAKISFRIFKRNIVYLWSLWCFVSFKWFDASLMCFKPKTFKFLSHLLMHIHNYSLSQVTNCAFKVYIFS